MHNYSDKMTANPQTFAKAAKSVVCNNENGKEQALNLAAGCFALLNIINADKRYFK
ncbi:MULTISPECIES: hypothetical protein [Undibacterium]|uniref:hypothetical protein n=1 Tax=Undibacterium TaxID=401469 RepID=UPI00138A69D3|nr:hypothetical protein [Undibacterium crateris]NDI84428.1 hypothetical protein [Undibacterium crateris]